MGIGKRCGINAGRVSSTLAAAANAYCFAKLMRFWSQDRPFGIFHCQREIQTLSSDYGRAIA
jgi:hypothetical protein